jgi:rare lipoprotein A
MSKPDARLPALLLSLLWIFAAPLAADEPSAMQEGEGSFYADSLHGNKTASGATYDKDAMTAAHHDLAFGTVVVVTYLKTGESVEVTINDRMAKGTDRVIDVSRAAAEKLGMIEDGHGPVTVEIVSP